MGCAGSRTRTIEKALALNLPRADAVYWDDGRLGDGSGAVRAAVYFDDKNAAKLVPVLSAAWRALPLDDSLRTVMYGGEAAAATTSRGCRYPGARVRVLVLS